MFDNVKKYVQSEKERFEENRTKEHRRVTDFFDKVEEVVNAYPFREQTIDIAEECAEQFDYEFDKIGNFLQMKIPSASEPMLFNINSIEQIWLVPGLLTTKRELRWKYNDLFSKVSSRVFETAAKCSTVTEARRFLENEFPYDFDFSFSFDLDVNIKEILDEFDLRPHKMLFGRTAFYKILCGMDVLDNKPRFVVENHGIYDTNLKISRNIPIEGPGCDAQINLKFKDQTQTIHVPAPRQEEIYQDLLKTL